MIKIMFKPFFKKYIGLFISMVFVSMLSIALLIGFVSTTTNLKATYQSYLQDYENVQGVVKINLNLRSHFSGLQDVEGVQTVDMRLTLDAYLKKSDGRIITARVYSFNEKENNLFNRYVLESGAKSDTIPNISVVRKFAENNNFKLGDTIKLGYFNKFIDFHISEIIETPEAIQARANDYVWSDNTDFGYLYVSEFELDKALHELSILIHNECESNPAYKEYYEKVVANIGADIPDLADEVLIGENYATKFTNQLLIHAKEGYSEKDVMANVKAYLDNLRLVKSEEFNLDIKQTTEAHQMFYIIYIENAIRQLNIASIFLPVFFYVVTMIVIALFINQIIKAMTPDIGVMMSIGVSPKNIIVIFLAFTGLMAVCAGILGIGTGIGINALLVNVMRRVYSMPTISTAIHPLITVLALISLFVFTEITTMIACQRIFKITPKDATLNNEAKRKPLPKWLAKIIDKSPMSIKLSLNSIAQNFRRFFVSTFSIFAGFVIIILSLFFYASKTELMDQTLNRRFTFDAQIYFLQKDDEIAAKLEEQDFVLKIEDCLYTYVEAEKNGNKTYLECLAFDANSEKGLVTIPNQKGKGNIKIEEEGIIISDTQAKALGVKVGDFINVGEQKIKVSAISKQYFHPIAYLSRTELERITDKSITSILVNTNNENALLNYLNNNTAGCLTVFTNSLSKDIHGIFDSIDIFIYIMIAFSLGMAFIILAIMSQNALMEQKRQLSVLRAIGFRIRDISNVWTLQSVSQLFFSTLFALPIGFLVSMLLFKACSSSAQVYPVIFSIKYSLFAFGFIFVIILASHFIAMGNIRSWNLADNTRSRE